VVRSFKPFNTQVSLDVLIGTVTKESSEFLPYVIDLQPIYNYNITKGIPKSVLCDVLAPEISNKHYNNDSKVSAAICEKYGRASYIHTYPVLAKFVQYFMNVSATYLSESEDDQSKNGN
jgi:hypothetical protein